LSFYFSKHHEGNHFSFYSAAGAEYFRYTKTILRKTPLHFKDTGTVSSGIQFISAPARIPRPGVDKLLYPDDRILGRKRFAGPESGQRNILISIFLIIGNM
jgi:hypothetical protein